jgi:hypothetical protein
MVSLDEAILVANKLEPRERLRLIARLWQSLPAESWPTVDDSELTDARRQLIESDVRWMEPVPWPVVERLLVERPRFRAPKIYSAPRRFDLATIFVVTVAFSLLFGAMSVLQFPPGASIAVGGFVMLVGVSQALLFGGTQPRTASLIVGAAIFSLAILSYWLITGARAFPTDLFLISGAFAITGGAILGYLSGTLIGGVFLLADYVRSSARALSGGQRVTTSEDV